MSKASLPSRRRLMKSAAAFAAVSQLPEWFLRREIAMAEESGPAPTTQPKLPVALIGCGGRGQYVREGRG